MSIPHSCGKRNEDLGAWQKCGIPVPPGPAEPQVLQAVLVRNKDSEALAEDAEGETGLSDGQGHLDDLGAFAFGCELANLRSSLPS